MATATLPPREEILVEHTWNNTSVFATPEAWSEAMAAVRAELPTIAAWQGHLSDGPTELVDILDGVQDYMTQVMKVAVYAFLTESVDTANQTSTERVGQAGSLFGQVGGTLSFIEPELLAIGQVQLDAWQAEEPRLQTYAHYFENLFRRQEHVRSPEVEEILGMLADPFQGPSSTFSKLADSDFDFPSATGPDGELIVSQGTIDDLLASPDRETRRTAWESYHDQYLAYKNTIASNLATSIKQNVFQMRARRYPTTVAMALHEDNIPEEVFTNLLETFQRHCVVWDKYWRVRRRALGVDELHTYDIWAPLTTERQKIPYEQSVEWIAAALEPLGDHYTSTLRRGCLDERWVDKYPNKGKTSGAFSWGTQGTYPFIVMSYVDDASSLGTLAHELGHSMHSYLSWENQPPVYANYSLFAAEVASNFNQAMMRAYLLKQDIDRNIKIAVIEEAMANFHRYFLEMPTLAMFEWEMHKRVEAGQGLTADSMIDYLADLFVTPYADTMVLDRQRDGIRWATFSHMYADYYVFQYATGISGANALARRVLSGESGAAEDYLGFLSAGGSRYPLEALADAGVDLSSPEPVEAAFGMLEDLVDQLDALID